MKEVIKDMKIFDQFKKVAWWDHNKFLDLFWERMEKKKKNS
jgi:hypothetical protein